MADKTQAQTAYNELKHRILIAELPSRYRLKEEEWAGKLRVSRAAIRESLTRLLGEGLLYSGERGGFFVMATTPEDIQQLRELREILETAAFALACQRATEDQVKEVEMTCDDFARMIVRGYQIGAREADLHFHRLIIAAANNPRLERAYQASNIPLFHMRLGQSSLHMNDFSETEQEHRAIIAALREKNVAKGIRLLKAHFRRGERWVLDD